MTRPQTIDTSLGRPLAGSVRFSVAGTASKLPGSASVVIATPESPPPYTGQGARPLTTAAVTQSPQPSQRRAFAPLPIGSCNSRLDQSRTVQTQALSPCNDPPLSPVFPATSGVDSSPLSSRLPVALSARRETFICPRCREGGFASMERAVQHCGGQKVVPVSTVASVRSEDEPVAPIMEQVDSDGTVKQLVKTTILFKCPVCSKIMPSREEAATHCLQATPAGEEQGTAGESSQPLGTLAAQGSNGGGGGSRPLQSLSGEAIAYDARGHATIVRQQDPTTGRKRTIVRNEDGSHDVFGESTVASLMDEGEAKAVEWLKNLSNHQLFGLNHEIGQRLVESSQIYQSHKAQFDKWRTDQDYLYFGLSEDATDKELDNAYRKLAKQMHPDKQHHKGVPLDRAKEQFQQMKKRYESLKAARAEASGKEPNPPSEDGEEKEEEESSKETSIKYDPTNRDSLTENAQKMLKQLKQLRASCEEIAKNLPP